ATLLRADVRLPANLTEGRFRVRVFLVRGGDVVDHLETAIDVEKQGLERWLHRLAFDRPFAYGILSLVIAVGAGWAASAAFRAFRR
ncbi:MAG: TIGR02186 family protein, partial [Gemmobacter sp.]